VIENESEKSLSPLVELHTSPIQSVMSTSLSSPSITNSNTKISTTPVPNTLFQKHQLKKKMSNSISMTGMKVDSLCDSSVGSLISTQLVAAVYDQTKPDVILPTSSTPGSNKDG
jgi:hypothetical protein